MAGNIERRLNKYIVFEGNDGSGKTTIAEEIGKKLGDNVLYTKEPGSPHLQFCKDVRELIIHGKKQNLDDITYAHLFYADAHEHLRQVIEPGLRNGLWIISDRSVLSNFAYWPEEVQHIHENHIKWFTSLYPLVFYLYVTPDICLERLKSRGKEINEFEKAHVVDKLSTIHSRYQNVVVHQTKLRNIPFYVINNMKEIDKVIEDVWGIITANFYELKRR